MKTAIRMTLTVLFCVVLCLCAVPAACADDGDYTIPANTTTIEDEAFSGCVGMKTVTIPASMTQIGTDAFAGCVNLTEIVFEGTTAQWAGVTIEAGNEVLSAFHVHCVDSAALVDSGTWGSLTWTLDENGLLVISGSGSMNLFFPSSTDAWLKYKTDIRSVVISKGVTSIGSAAFYGCDGLTSVTIPDSVTSIGSAAFVDCTGLKSVHISDIAAWCQIVFYEYHRYTNISKMTVIANPLYYAHNLYLNGDLVTTLDIPDGVTSISDYAFDGCNSLNKVTIPNGVAAIGDFAFYRCHSLKSVTIPHTVDSIGTGAFAECSLSSAGPIGSGYDYQFGWTEAIPDNAFSGCSDLVIVDIPNSVTSIGDWAFYNCSDLAIVEIPESVNSIGDFNFFNCSGLTSVTILNRELSFGNYLFGGCDNLTIYCYPDSTAHKYAEEHGINCEFL